MGDTHYVCTGECGGVSMQPGVCAASDCSNYQNQLRACDCDDPNHNPTSASEEVNKNTENLSE